MNKPIKRSKSLVWLSRDHHHGLLIVWKLKQGISYNVSEKVLADFILHEYDMHLAAHFTDEETLLFEEAPATDELTIEAKEQHSTIRQLIQVLHNQPSLEKVQQFLTLLEEHIRFEERILFRHYEEIFDEDKLQNIEARLNETHSSAKLDTWTNEFWIRVSA